MEGGTFEHAVLLYNKALILVRVSTRSDNMLHSSSGEVGVCL